MSRRIKIINVNPGQVFSPGGPGSFVIGTEPDNLAGNWTEVFKGKFYRDPGGATQDYYLHGSTVPAGFTLIKATTFQVVENARYAGTYSVFTKTAILDSTTFLGGETVVRVNQTVPAPLTPTDLTDGYITNVSTYYVLVDGLGPVVIPPTVNLANMPVELIGRDTIGWGEGYAQNLLRLSQTFSGDAAPTAPLRGQLWYSPSTNRLRVWTGTAWAQPNRHEHQQLTADVTWTITHSFDLPVPFLVDIKCYVDIGGGVYEQALPATISYASANQVVVTFSVARSGIAVVTI